MSLGVVGQRCMSEREPELGLGIVASVDKPAKRIGIKFPATGEQRLYALGTSVLKRVQFRAGETVHTRDGVSLLVESVEDDTSIPGLLVYLGKPSASSRSPHSSAAPTPVPAALSDLPTTRYPLLATTAVREDALSDVTSVALPQERFMAGQTDDNETFDLRYRALQARARFRSSDVRGFLGGRLELIPHQFFLLQEISSRQIPRVLLADEVGLGKTIEACLILQRLLAVGKVKRALILVPESLTHQWFVELLRRFNLWFTIFDEVRCYDIEASDPGKNPFHSSQLALASITLLANVETRREQALSAGWDLVIVDEAHHLQWTPDAASAEYSFVETLAQRTPGLLLLTATPTQLGLAGHFARLRLLDPARYDNLDTFLEESENFGVIAQIAEKIIEQKPLAPKDHATLKKIFTRDPARLDELLAALSAAKPGARDDLLKTLLDQHGTGRVVFRNTRAAMTGFPKRQACPAPLATDNVTLLHRIARELEAEETGADAAIRYSFKDDPRIDWLAAFLQKHRPAKVLLICKSQRKVAAIDTALKEKLNINVGLFHEGLPLVARDRQAAWFAEPEGAQLLIASEIGSEGRNFQFAHHLVLFDLPLNPGLIEQRIGRLDRIGQTQTIRIHIPYIAGSADEAVFEWYHRGLDAFETPIHGGTAFREKFHDRLLPIALGTTSVANSDSGLLATRYPLLATLIAETGSFKKDLDQKLKKGRDRLLELNSFNAESAARIIERIRAVDADPSLRRFLVALLDHFGVRIKEHEEGDVFFDPSHAYVESFPSIPADGLLATFKRERAIVREDIGFLSPDHPLVRDAIDLLIDSPSGTTAFGTLPGDKPNILLEAIFLLETVADTRWHVDQFLAPTPVRVLVDLRGNDLTDARPAEEIADLAEDSELHRFLEKPGFNAAILKALLDGANDIAAKNVQTLKTAADSRAATALGADLQRLVDLRKLNDNIRPEEIALAQEQLTRTREAIAAARLRLDSLRLLLEGSSN
jgi:ATP-dependent helicase HepA